MSSWAWTVIGAPIGGVVTLVGVLLARPKLRAEARKTNAQAGQIEWQTLRDEINRLDRGLADVRKELATVKNKAAEEKTGLERENRRLKTEISRLKIRVRGLEDILKVAPLTPELRALVDEIDRKTAGEGLK